MTDSTDPTEERLTDPKAAHPRCEHCGRWLRLSVDRAASDTPDVIEEWRVCPYCRHTTRTRLRLG